MSIRKRKFAGKYRKRVVYIDLEYKTNLILNNLLWILDKDRFLANLNFRMVSGMD